MNNAFGNQDQILDAAANAMQQMGASDALMGQLYNSNPRVRQIVDQYRGQSIDDLLRGVGVDPSAARKRFGIPR